MKRRLAESAVRLMRVNNLYQVAVRLPYPDIPAHRLGRVGASDLTNIAANELKAVGVVGPLFASVELYPYQTGGGVFLRPHMHIIADTADNNRLQLRYRGFRVGIGFIGSSADFMSDDGEGGEEIDRAPRTIMSKRITETMMKAFGYLMKSATYSIRREKYSDDETSERTYEQGEEGEINDSESEDDGEETYRRAYRPPRALENAHLRWLHRVGLGGTLVLVGCERHGSVIRRVRQGRFGTHYGSGTV